MAEVRLLGIGIHARGHLPHVKREWGYCFVTSRTILLPALCKWTLLDFDPRKVPKSRELDSQSPDVAPRWHPTWKVHRPDRKLPVPRHRPRQTPIRSNRITAQTAVDAVFAFDPQRCRVEGRESCACAVLDVDAACDRSKKLRSEARIDGNTLSSQQYVANVIASKEG